MDNRLKMYADLPMWKYDSTDQMTMIHEAAQTMEKFGFAGSLLFYTHQTLDPWVVATSTLQATTTHIPIIALQPYTIPPFTAAKMIHSMAHLFGRKVAINVIPGLSQAEQQQVNNPVTYEQRFDRLVEYTEILRLLLNTDEPITYEGKFYQYKDLHVHAKISPDLQPIIFVAGFSDEFREAAFKVADVAIQTVAPVSQMVKSFGPLYGSNVELAARVGIIARPTYEEAMQAAEGTIETRFQQIFKKRLRKAGEYTEQDERVYFPESGKEIRGPLLIGSYDEVADYFQQYVDLGVRHVILSNIRSIEDMRHVQQVLERASSLHV